MKMLGMTVIVGLMVVSAKANTLMYSHDFDSMADITTSYPPGAGVVEITATPGGKEGNALHVGKTGVQSGAWVIAWVNKTLATPTSGIYGLTYKIYVTNKASADGVFLLSHKIATDDSNVALVGQYGDLWQWPRSPETTYVSPMLENVWYTIIENINVNSDTADVYIAQGVVDPATEAMTYVGNLPAMTGDSFKKFEFRTSCGSAEDGADLYLDDLAIYDGAISVVPEPATMSIIALGGLVTLIRRRRS